MRACAVCQTPIEGCNGFVRAGDVMELLAGSRKPCAVRELCGKCVMRWGWGGELALIPPSWVDFILEQRERNENQNLVQEESRNV